MMEGIKRTGYFTDNNSSVRSRRNTQQTKGSRREACGKSKLACCAAGATRSKQKGVDVRRVGNQSLHVLAGCGTGGRSIDSEIDSKSLRSLARTTTERVRR